MHITSHNLLDTILRRLTERRKGNDPSPSTSPPPSPPSSQESEALLKSSSLSYLPSPPSSPSMSTSTLSSSSGTSPSPSHAARMSAEEDVQRLKEWLFMRLLCAFALGSLVYLGLCVAFDRTLATFPALLSAGSTLVYSGLLLLLFVGRGRPLRAVAFIAVCYHHLALLIRCAVYGLGVRSECFVWLQQLPVLVFFMLGRKAGVMATLLVVVEGLVLLLNEGPFVDRVYPIECARMNHDDGVVVISSECSMKQNGMGLQTSSFDDSPLEIWMSRTFALLLLSGFAYAYEEIRTFAMENMERVLKEKEATNASLRKATQAKIQFMSNISHELRTPLHGIIAMTREMLGMQLCEKARESAKIVSDCADHLLGLVNDILDFSRFEAQKFELEAIPFCVVDEIKRAVNLHMPLAGSRGVTLIANEPQLEHPYRIGDPLRLRQILVNLISNAIKFTPEGGHVTLHVRDSAVNREEISVRVEDTGIGIPEEFMEHLFDSFSQLDSSVRRRHGGPGLGLAICKKLCEAMGGRIWCESMVGCGSTFYFTIYLPTYSPSPRSSSPTMSRMEQQSQGTKVLVVEDNPINQKVATKMLSSLGCTVKVASDGAAGVDMFEKENFDVILMDVQMPIMDGFQATARIRQIERQRRNSQPDISKTGSDDGKSKKDNGPEEERKAADEADQEHDEREEEVLDEIKKEVAEAEEEVVSGQADSFVANGQAESEEEVRNQLRALEEQPREVPIVALTASATREYEEKCIEQGMTCFLTKPLKRETLLATLSSVCGKVAGAPRGRNNSV